MGFDPSRGDVWGLLPELAARLPEVAPYRAGHLAEARQLMADAMSSTAAPADLVWNTAGPTGAAVELRIHLPTGRPPTGALLHIHGGGFFMGSALLYDAVCRDLAERTGTAVVSVDYRLAPEHPYPAAIDDCESGWTTVMERVGELGIAADRVGIYGESAGAALAIALLHRLHVRGAQLPSYLVAQEPVIDDRLEEASSRQFIDTPVWNRELALWSWSLYLGVSSLGDSPSAPSVEFSPARLEDVSWFPPTFVSTRDRDPLRDEGLSFARRLIDAGVPVDIRHYSGTFHGCVGITGTAVAERIIRDAAEYIRERA